MASHELMRLCIGCRTRENTANLVRVALDTTSDTRSLVLDKRRVLPGRGAWLHPDPKCFSIALQKRAFARAFRRQVDTEKIAQTLNQWPTKNTNTPNNDESGSEI
ncbi:YlxR family protein [Enteractinococcus coprophilus]|uniref:YlxR domain-containing protein n=1 Tax=Enteractinococcus coprophilus TaxID=1027633 RepID=A0A543AK50_9MICC|nr:YlxR family protein [Enteractinococcus coprophilus]TQL72949.1 hypothetical protein FB556_1622 [Enteractinococcus coprophilus]